MEMPGDSMEVVFMREATTGPDAGRIGREGDSGK